MMAMTSANDLHAASTDWTATRTVGAQQYIPGQSIQICINVSPAAATRVYVVEETPPAGWTVRNVNEKGVWDSITGHIRWGMFWDSNPRQLCYELIPPTVAGKDGQFAGIASYDGMVVLITGDSSIESGFSMTSAVSRRSHGAAGPFDISMPLGGDGAGVECRAGSSLSLVLTFSRPVAPGVGSASDGVLSDGPADDQKTLTVSNVQDVSCLALILNDVTDNDGAPLMGPDRLVVAQLAGDVNADQVVNVVDLLMIRSRMNLPLATDGFRMDVNADGRINVVDLLVARANVNRSLAGTCP